MNDLQEYEVTLYLVWLCQCIFSLQRVKIVTSLRIKFSCTFTYLIHRFLIHWPRKLKWQKFLQPGFGPVCNILYPWKLPTIQYKEHMYVIYEHNILAPIVKGWLPNQPVGWTRGLWLCNDASNPDSGAHNHVDALAGYLKFVDQVNPIRRNDVVVAIVLHTHTHTHIHPCVHYLGFIYAKTCQAEKRMLPTQCKHDKEWGLLAVLVIMLFLTTVSISQQC